MRTIYVNCGLCAAVALLLLASCDEEDPKVPLLCLFTANQIAPNPPEKVDAASCPENFHVQDDEGFYILHQLPDGIVANKPLRLSLITPCTRVPLEAEYTSDQVDAGTEL